MSSRAHLVAWMVLGASAAHAQYTRWLDDVNYIITPEERGAYLRLTTPHEKELFVTQFWERRNPNPGTLDNPYRQEFERRVRNAQAQFGTSAVRGHKTDRGRIYILYGPP